MITVKYILFLCSFLDNRFHVAVRLFINRSQMTSKCVKTKKVLGVSCLSLVLGYWCPYLRENNVICDLT